MQKKHKIFSLFAYSSVIMILVISSCVNKKEKTIVSKESKDLKGYISISGAFAVYPLTVTWAEEFQKEYPRVKIDVTAGGTGKGMADALSHIVDLGMSSRGVSTEETEKRAWWITVAMDAVLPTINANNPCIDEIKAHGIDKNTFKSIFISNNILNWGEFLKINNSTKINLYNRSDACGAAAMWAQYIGKTQDDLQGIKVFGDPGMAEAIKNDIYGIGYNNVVYVYDIKTREKYEGLEVIPIDVNNNGAIDSEENFYENLDSITKAIKMGIYPSPPARELFFVSKGKPEKEEVTRFLQWILTTGQKFVNEAGYVHLSENKIKSELQKLK